MSSNVNLSKFYKCSLISLSLLLVFGFTSSFQIGNATPSLSSGQVDNGKKSYQGCGYNGLNTEDAVDATIAKLNQFSYKCPAYFNETDKKGLDYLKEIRKFEEASSDNETEIKTNTINVDHNNMSTSQPVSNATSVYDKTCGTNIPNDKEQKNF